MSYYWVKCVVQSFNVKIIKSNKFLKKLLITFIAFLHFTYLINETIVQKIGLKTWPDHGIFLCSDCHTLQTKCDSICHLLPWATFQAVQRGSCRHVARVRWGNLHYGLNIIWFICYLCLLNHKCKHGIGCTMIPGAKCEFITFLWKKGYLDLIVGVTTSSTNEQWYFLISTLIVSKKPWIFFVAAFY